jgi:anaerobic magnesium-protoporphyrin IX monomethyl ester cyclase
MGRRTCGEPPRSRRGIEEGGFQPSSYLISYSKENLPLPDSWTGYSQLSYDSLPLPTKYLSGVEVLRFRDRAFQAYFNNPDYLNMIQEKFGIEVVAHIKEMVSTPLKRKYSEEKE